MRSLPSMPIFTGMKRRGVVDRQIDAARAVHVDHGVGRAPRAHSVRLGHDADARIHARVSAGTAQLGISISIGAVRVAGSSTGETRAMRPMESLAGERIDFDSRRVADADLLQILLDDVGDQPDAS